MQVLPKDRQLTGDRMQASSPSMPICLAPDSTEYMASIHQSPLGITNV